MSLVSLFKNVAVAVTSDWSLTVGSVIVILPLLLSTVIPFGRVPWIAHEFPSFLAITCCAAVCPVGTYENVTLSVSPCGVILTVPSAGPTTEGAVGFLPFIGVNRRVCPSG